jgi:hypothetical protein
MDDQSFLNCKNYFSFLSLLMQDKRSMNYQGLKLILFIAPNSNLEVSDFLGGSHLIL